MAGRPRGDAAAARGEAGAAATGTAAPVGLRPLLLLGDSGGVEEEDEEAEDDMVVDRLLIGRSIDSSSYHRGVVWAAGVDVLLAVVTCVCPPGPPLFC